MATTSYEEAVISHYTTGGLGDKILASLRAAGKNPDALRVEDLAPLDQFHSGGLAATRELLRRSGVKQGMRVLDVGGGIGGPARLLAHTTGCSVTVLDLSEEYCQVGELLTSRVGLAGSVTFRHGSALAIPFAEAAFDLVWTQHSLINIAEKSRSFAEIHRVLTPGGRLAMQEIMAGPVQPLCFPVPWATDAATSFLLPPTEIRALLESIGFREVEWTNEGIDVVAAARAAQAGQSQVGFRPFAALALGPRLPEMQANAERNLREDRTILVRAVFERP
jgi:ubiquinone/menaquinone biosynthesis C-methylase UbiE